MNPTDPNDRLRLLEERLAFQDRVIDDLNEALLHQQQRLEQLDRQLTALTRTLQQLAEQAQEGDLPHEKPPHY